MSFSPYIHFQGNCADAMQVYAKVFGATDLQIMRYRDAPPSAGLPQGEHSDKVMHASLSVGGQTLMASDFPDHMPGDPQAAVSISHSVADAAQGSKIFDKLGRWDRHYAVWPHLLFARLWHGKGQVWNALDDHGS